MVYTVALNPSLDVTLWIDRLDPDVPVVSRRERCDPAGKAVNVSRVLTTLGVPSRLFGVLGGGNAERFRTLLAGCGVEGEFLEVPGFIRENLSLVTGKTLYKVDRAGFSLPAEKLAALGGLLRETLSARAEAHPLIVFAGSLPEDLSPRCYRDFILPFREAGARVVLDSAFWTPEDLHVLRPFAVKPNREEFSKLTGRTFSGTRELFDAAAAFTDSVEHVLLSLGGDGLFYAGDGMRLLAKVPAVEVRSCVGAGDSALAGFLAALEAGEELRSCVRFAAACGTAAVSVEGTGVLCRETAEAVLPLVRLEDGR